MSLRWGFGLGAIAAAIGAMAQLLSAVFGPIPANTTADLLVIALLIQGVLSLVALGVMFAISYLAGQRTERDRQREYALQGSEGTAPPDRSSAVLAGGVVAICYWFVTTLILYLVPATQQGSTHLPDVKTFLIQSLLRGAFYVLVGAGMGGLGARSVVARQLMQSVVKPAFPAPRATIATPPAMPPPPATPPPTEPSAAVGADGEAPLPAE
ncbi:MAG TPA: hypothetical protein VE258_10210 [Ktedonobacterales bacterium]|jgi:hypothetical protein|nr:hypothetical protein [Ktedonobacterales bacterium]